jgi:hypothetical protein
VSELIAEKGQSFFRFDHGKGQEEGQEGKRSRENGRKDRKKDEKQNEERDGRGKCEEKKSIPL